MAEHVSKAVIYYSTLAHTGICVRAVAAKMFKTRRRNFAPLTRRSGFQKARAVKCTFYLDCKYWP